MVQLYSDQQGIESERLTVDQKSSNRNIEIRGTFDEPLCDHDRRREGRIQVTLCVVVLIFCMLRWCLDLQMAATAFAGASRCDRDWLSEFLDLLVEHVTQRLDTIPIHGLSDSKELHGSSQSQCLTFGHGQRLFVSTEIEICRLSPLRHVAFERQLKPVDWLLVIKAGIEDRDSVFPNGLKVPFRCQM